MALDVLLFGGRGQVGSEIRAATRNSTKFSVRSPDRNVADLSVSGDAAAAILSARPEVIINAAAYTAVDRAESEPALAAAVNESAAGEMAKAAAEVGAALVHISTDYVFDGIGDKPIAEDSPTNPLNVYGRTKFAGERQVLSTPGLRAAVIRTSWVFSPHGGNFVKTMLRLATDRQQLRVVADQIGGPTAAADIAHACLALATGLRDGGPLGVFHFQGAPSASWAEFARAIFNEAGLAMQVEDIATDAYPTPARRPLRTVLDCRRIQQSYGLAQPDWRPRLAETVQALRA